MTRVKYVNSPKDYPGTPDEETKRELTEFFQRLFPGSENPRIDGAHSGFAIAAQSPKMAIHLHTMSRYFVLELGWSKRRDLLELAVQTLNLKYGCESSFEAHVPHAKDHGISAEMQSALPYWRTTSFFNDEQRLVIEFTEAVVEGEVPKALFSRAVERFGERGTIEFTAAVAWWSFWAMILNATRDPAPP